MTYDTENVRKKKKEKFGKSIVITLEHCTEISEI